MRALDRVCLDKVDVRHMTEDELGRVGIRLINREEVILQCLNCEETWEASLDCSGKLPAGYWHCPAGCNRLGKSSPGRKIDRDRRPRQTAC